MDTSHPTTSDSAPPSRPHAPDDPKNSGLTPPPSQTPPDRIPSPSQDNVLVLKPAQLQAELHRAYNRLDQSREEWTRELTARLSAVGKVNPWQKPFIVILDRTSGDPTEVNSIALDRSIDFTVYHSIGLTTSRLAKYGVDPLFRQTAKDFLAPQLARRLAQIGWAEAQSWYEFVVESAWLEGKRLAPANAKSILEDLRDTVWAPLPEPVAPILDHLLEAAHPLAAARGLNGTQLFIENRLGPLMARHPALKAFKALSPETQKAASQWLIDALRWNPFYPIRGHSSKPQSNLTNPA